MITTRSTAIFFVAAITIGSAATTGCIASLEDAEFEPINTAEQELTTTCIGDNDWSGSTSCFAYSQLSDDPWIYDTSNGYYGDMRYSTSKYASATWEFQTFPRRGITYFEVYIPSTNATALAEYELNCGYPVVGTYTVNQLNFSNEWVRISGAIDMLSGMSCSVTVYRPSHARTTKKIAMDAIRYKITY